MSERSEERELMELARALRELRPKKETIHRDVLMYRAGRASARSRLWPSIAATTTTLAVVLGGLLFVRPAPPVVERIVYVTAPAVPQEPPSFKSEEGVPTPEPESLVLSPLDSSPRDPYLQLQERVLRLGLKGIPPPAPAVPQDAPPSVEQLLQSL
jgi:hypothetical protein